MTDDTQNRLPRIAIVGRPNVGKSAIFNRLVGKRIAIVHEESGVTRDRLTAVAKWEGGAVELTDTGGVAPAAGTPLERQIQSAVTAQVRQALAEADLVFWVVDVTDGPAPLDEAFKDLLRPLAIPVLVLANKCDTAARDEDTPVFERFGFPVFPVAALHNLGFDEVEQAVWRLIPASPGAIPAPLPALKIAVVGRPNVGKSSLINRLIRDERLIVADQPGTTRDSIDLPFTLGEGERAKSCVLIDTAGMRAMRRIDSAVERYSLFRAQAGIERADICLLIIDGAQGPTAHDKKVADAILTARKGCVVVVNKWDRLSGVSTTEEYGEALGRVLPFLSFAPVVYVSATTGWNLQRLPEAILRVAEGVRQTLPTGPLNRCLLDAYTRTAPPTVKGKRMKLFYAAQVGVQPQKIILFVNDPTRLTSAYTSYLTAALRRQFGLVGAPVLLLPKARQHSKIYAGQRHT